MFKSATVKLTLWYVFLAMSLSFLFSGVLYHFSTSELAEALHTQYQVLNDKDKDDNSYISTYELNTRSHHLLNDLAYFNVLVLVGSGMASYVLARRTLKPIEAAHQAQIRFTADASHELRTPLTAMKADTEATLMNSNSDVALLRRTLRDNLGDIDRLEKLTDHLVEISRYDSQVEATKKDVDLQALIDETVQQFNRRIKGSKLKIKVETRPIIIKADSYGLQQLITIILDNAAKYSRPRGQIKVRLLKKSKHVILTVEDNGIGIAKDDLPHIFERFYRSKKIAVNKKDTMGYGLGLPLARDIAALHNGSVTVQSKENEGTTVTVSLPIT